MMKKIINKRHKNILEIQYVILSAQKLLNLQKNSFLANEDDEKKESSQHVARVHQAEEDLHILVFPTRLPIIAVDDKMNTFNDPQNSHDKKKLEVQGL